MTHAIVVGAGFGGLAAALRLRADGHEVTVVDALPIAGGRATVFRRGIRKYDAGPTVITAPVLLQELFELFGERLEDKVALLPVEPFYRMLFADGTQLDYATSQAELVAQMSFLSPEDASRYPEFLRATRQRYQSGYVEMGTVPFKGTLDMLRALPTLIKLRADRSVYSFVSGFFKDKRIRQAFSIQPLLIGGNPLDTSSLYSLIHYLERQEGVWYARGGTGALVKGLVALAKRAGIKFEFNAKVTSIEVRDGRARAVMLQDGRTLECDITVANADPGHVYENLLVPAARGKWQARRLRKVRYSMSLFVVYFTTRKRYESVRHHTVLFDDDYIGALKDIFRRKKLSDDLNIYLHRPTATDIDAATPGHDTMYALIPVPSLDADIDWNVQGRVLRQKIIETLQRRLLPQLQEHIVDCFHVDPRYFRDELMSPFGAAFSMAPLLTQSAGWRFPSQAEMVPNLFFVGAGVHPGAGIPGVLCSAKVAQKLWRTLNVRYADH